MNIRRLPPDVAAKIAAGEVLERPANAAKELVENSVDAGATEIKIEIRDGGQRLLRVTDNGNGIPEDEIGLALERHATSKVREAQDLERITTFGFRGEALYSIAAVSQLTLSSRHQDEKSGVELRSEGGKIVSQKPTGLPVGTVVSVEHLFYNVPARQKYLRRASTEAGHIRAAVQCAALAHPDRCFSLVVDGRPVFRSTGSGDVFDVLAEIYSLDEAKQMVPIGKLRRAGTGEPDDLPDEVSFMPVSNPDSTSLSSRHAALTVSGYVSLPTLTRANRSYIDLFVNRRHIEDRSLTHSIVQAYHTLLPVGRYPVAVLFVDVAPNQLDVNVHPRKTEVRFQREREIYAEVQKTVRRAVIDNATIPDLPISWDGSSADGDAASSQASSWKPRAPLQHAPPSVPQYELDLSAAPEDGGDATQSGTERRQRSSYPQPQPALGTAGSAAPKLPDSDPAQTLPPLRVVGQIGASYVVAEGPEGLYLIDQHAAHERIMYEKFMSERYEGDNGIARQGLLDPITLHVGDRRATVMEEHLEALDRVGFDVEPFGGATFVVRAVPSALSDQDAETVLFDILQGLEEERNLVGEELEAQLVKMVCKRASIKAGQVLSDMEMQELLVQLEACRSPRTCPHGRPTMIQLTANELDKAFKRT